MMKEIHLDETDEPIQLDLWDTAGQEEYADLTKSYYRNSGGCALAFSTTDRYAFVKIIALFITQCFFLPIGSFFTFGVATMWSG